MNRIMSMVIVSAVLALSFVEPAYAASSSTRVSYLKYYLCLANPLVLDKTLCHL